MEKLKELLESAREPPREIMNAKEAADFLRLSEAHFRKIAPAAPRHKIPGLGFRYIRSELLDWLRSHDDGTPNNEAVKQPAGEPPAPGSEQGSKRRAGKRVKRLV